MSVDVCAPKPSRAVIAMPSPHVLAPRGEVGSHRHSVKESWSLVLAVPARRQPLLRVRQVEPAPLARLPSSSAHKIRHRLKNTVVNRVTRVGSFFSKSTCKQVTSQGRESGVSSPWGHPAHANGARERDRSGSGAGEDISLPPGTLKVEGDARRRRDRCPRSPPQRLRPAHSCAHRRKCMPAGMPSHRYPILGESRSA